MSATTLRVPLTWSLIVAFVLTGILAAVHPAHATVSSGQLIRGESFSAVYYMGDDGFRYVFPNEKTYGTWYENFDDVIWITDAELGDIQIGGNVTYRPGVKMVKIQSDPRTYAVDHNGELRHITSEDIATELYGSNWNTKVDDIPDSFFSNYSIGEPIMSASDYSITDSMASSTTINNDKDLEDYETMFVTDSGFHTVLSLNDTLTINAGGTVRFTNSGATKHAATADDGSWGTGSIDPGESYTLRFTEEGTYDFYDPYNEDATGIIEVE